MFLRLFRVSLGGAPLQWNSALWIDIVQNTSVELLQWLREIWTSASQWWTFDRKFDAIVSVWYWMAETLIWGFELEVLTTLEKDGSLELDRNTDSSIDPNDIRFCEEDMQELLEY
ncbi:hypothetical protein BGX38DRAFT_1146187 [Terfezia claveryi]|nr:hypothetical protein BGX38DRAFT_1146187 [Terfezia claveryi]